MKEPPSWWYKGSIPLAAWALWPVAVGYGRIVERRFRTTEPYRSALPVICVGNFTMGGAGKTPAALKIAALLKEAGRNPGFLTRGYGGSERGPHLIDAASDGADRVGDEPLLLARAAPTVVSRDRPAGAMLLETLGVDMIIMDDGFQNPSLSKDFSLVVVDGGAGVGSGRVFPLGPLRAPLGFQLGLADAVLVLRGEQLSLTQGLRGLPIFHARVVTIIGDELRERPYLAFCGIGRPAKFYDTLQEAGVAIAKTRSFPDHHPFSEADAASLLAEAEALGACLITTEKDRARLKGKEGARGELYQAATDLPITIRFDGDDEKSLMAAILGSCAR
jgi:tetraacyldisaccharide 4'-kinase